MHPNKVIRDKVRLLTDLPNIGQEMRKDLVLMGIVEPSQLIGLCPYEMHRTLSELSNAEQDPCVIDVFIAITRFMSGEEPQPWWKYTAERKAHLAN